MRIFLAFVFTVCSATLLPAADNAKQRYKDELFTNFTLDSIIYSSPDGTPLWMDIYQPVGDTAAHRPVVILAHGGSFMHGNRKSERMPLMCRMLTQRGYVAVSIDYRLTTLVGMASKPAAYKNILKSVADGRAAVSWLLRDIDKGNTYRIDKTQLFVGGSSAGAILTQQLAFIDSTAECTGALCTQAKRYLPDSLSLPPGTIKGVISLAGAVLDTGIIGNHQPALLHIHGDADRIVQYGYKRAVKGWAPFKMAGLGGSRQRYTSQKLNYTEYVFPKAGHTPWDRDDAMFKIVMQQVVEFLWREVR